MQEFEIKGSTYRADKLTAMQQFNVSRRIAPLLPPLIPIAMRLVKLLPQDGSAPVIADIEKLISHPELIQPFADALASMPDETVNYVFDECLSVVKRQLVDGSFMRIWDRRTHTALSDDVGDSEVLFPLVLKVIVINLGPFIRGLLMTQSAKPAVGVQ